MWKRPLPVGDHPAIVDYEPTSLSFSRLSRLWQRPTLAVSPGLMGTSEEGLDEELRYSWSGWPVAGRKKMRLIKVNQTYEPTYESSCGYISVIIYNVYCIYIYIICIIIYIYNYMY